MEKRIMEAKRIWRIEKATGQTSEIVAPYDNQTPDHLSGWKKGLADCLADGSATVEKQEDGRLLVQGSGRADFLLSF